MFALYKQKLFDAIQRCSSESDNKYIIKYFHNDIDRDFRRVIYDKSYIADGLGARFIDVCELFKILHLSNRSTKAGSIEEVIKNSEASLKASRETIRDSQLLIERCKRAIKGIKEIDAAILSEDQMNDILLGPKHNTIIYKTSNERLATKINIATISQVTELIAAVLPTQQYKSFVLDTSEKICATSEPEFKLKASIEIAGIDAKSRIPIDPIIFTEGTIGAVSSKSVFAETLCYHTFDKINRELGTALLTNVSSAVYQASNLDTIECIFEKRMQKN